MSVSWPQGAQPSGEVPNRGPFQGPPPSCYNCGGTHYLVNCPEQKRSHPAGLNAPPGVGTNPQKGYGPSGGTFTRDEQWSNGSNGSVAALYTTHKPPPVTRYAAPGASQQFGGASGSYGPTTAPPSYQQYGSAQPNQSYPPPQASFLSNAQQFGPLGGTPYSSQPPAQTYSGPPAAQHQYGNPGYQAPPQNFYPQPSGPPQYGNLGYQVSSQQYAPPVIAPYQQRSHSYPPQNTSYSGPSPVQDQASQWSNAIPTSSYAASPFPQQPSSPPLNTGYKREYSGTPSQQSVPQRQQTPYQTPQQRLRSEPYQATDQTPNSNSMQPTPAPTHQESFPSLQQPSGLPEESKLSSRASTPHSRRESTASSQQEGRRPSATPSFKVVEDSDTKMEIGAKYEDGELTEEDLHEQEFVWEVKMAFFEQPPTENVRLAQPLSTTWESTPVPLLDPRLNNSVSRYARKDNLKDFIRPIRSQPQWSYLKDDPAFSDSKLDEVPLIPLHEVPAWMAARHGVELPNSDRPSSSRKRGRSEGEDEQEDIDNQIKLEAGTEPLCTQASNKRQKNEQVYDEDTVIMQTSNTPTSRPGTPTLGSAGTPSFGAEDDVWAPQPGEGAAPAPIDPTEALLASLGVSGSPKPVRKPSVAPLSIDEPAHNATPDAGVPQSISPQPNQIPGSHYLTYNNPPQGPPHQFNPPYNSSPDAYAPQAQYTNSMSPQGNSYPIQQHNSYGNGISPPGHGLYHNQPFGMPRQSSYNNVSLQANQPPAGQAYGTPSQNSYGNGTSQQNFNVYNNLPAMPPQAQYPPQSQYGPLQGNGQYASYPQQAAPFTAPYGNASYIMPSQPYPPQNQYNGMPSNNGAAYPQNSGSYPHLQDDGSYAQGNVPYGNPPYGVPQSGHLSHPPYNNNPRNFQQPPRQDSGYVSARGSYSNGSGTNQNISNIPPQQQTSEEIRSQPQGPLDGSNDTPTPPKPEPEETNFFASLPSQFPHKTKSKALKIKLEKVKTEDISGDEAENDESPLSPTSLEILGRLIPESEKKEPSRQGEDGLVRKVKRPQPVIAAAYSRRW